MSLFIGSLVSAKIDDLKPLLRSNLMLLTEKRRYTNELVMDIYAAVVDTATSGESQYVSQFTGCTNPKLNDELCNSIVTDVFKIVQTKFPDSDVKYNSDDKTYKISWA